MLISKTHQGMNNWKISTSPAQYIEWKKNALQSSKTSHQGNGMSGISMHWPTVSCLCLCL